MNQQLIIMKKALQSNHLNLPIVEDAKLSQKLSLFVESSSKVDENKQMLDAVKSHKLKFKHLPPLLSYTMQALKEVNNVPEELAIQAILGTVNFATQNLYNVDPVFFGGNIIPTSLYLVGLAPTAGMKSTIYKMLDAGIKRFEEDEKVRYGNELTRYTMAHAFWTKDYEKVKKGLTTADINDQDRLDSLINSVGPEPQHPVSCKYRLSTATRNGLIEFLDKLPFGGMSSSEAGEFFNGHAFQDGKNNSKGFEMITTLTNLWDGAPIEKQTGVESRFIQHRRFCMLFLLQKAMAKDWLGNKTYSEQGFVHRLLITHADYWDVPELDRSRRSQIQQSENKLNMFHDRIYQLLSQQRSFKEGSKLELDLPTMFMSDEACDLLAKFDNKIKREQTTTYCDWQGFVSRLYEQSVRIAATIAIFEGATKIELSHAECAVELAQFYLDQRMSLDLGASSKYANQVSVAEKLASKILEKLTEGVTIDRAWLNRSSPSYFRDLSKDERKQIISEIQSRGEISFEDVNGKTIAVKK